MILCKRPDPPDDHLQEAGSYGWSFAKTKNNNNNKVKEEEEKEEKKEK